MMIWLVHMGGVAVNSEGESAGSGQAWLVGGGALFLLVVLLLAVLSFGGGREHS